LGKVQQKYLEAKEQFSPYLKMRI